MSGRIIGRKTEGTAARVFALACHPDDIEFMMAGTLFLLGETGCELHYMNLANGSCGSMELGAEEIARVRRDEARRAAAALGAVFHESLVNDLEVFYTRELIRRVAAVIRQVEPDILLIPSPEDYMEDHMNTSRIAVTAAFCRGVPNYSTIPEVPPVNREIALYHAMPYGLADGLGRPVKPEFYIDITRVIGKKRDMLACHESQKKWLDASQGLDAYLDTMTEMSEAVGRMSGRYRYAEGWRRHSHLGYSAAKIDPLGELLKENVSI